jgi:hypothetical protein
MVSEFIIIMYNRFKYFHKIDVFGLNTSEFSGQL